MGYQEFKREKMTETVAFVYLRKDLSADPKTEVSEGGKKSASF
jgi:hypothetical protein